jgi:hypothetical protein
MCACVRVCVCACVRACARARVCEYIIATEKIDETTCGPSGGNIEKLASIQVSDQMYNI